MEYLQKCLPKRVTSKAVSILCLNQDLATRTRVYVYTRARARNAYTYARAPVYVLARWVKCAGAIVLGEQSVSRCFIAIKMDICVNLRENSFTKLNLQERIQNILPREFLQKRISFSLCDWLILSSIRGQTRKIACADVTSNSIFQARKVIDDDFSHFYPTINSLLIKALPA